MKSIYQIHYLQRDLLGDVTWYFWVCHVTNEAKSLAKSIKEFVSGGATNQSFAIAYQVFFEEYYQIQKQSLKRQIFCNILKYLPSFKWLWRSRKKQTRYIKQPSISMSAIQVPGIGRWKKFQSTPFQVIYIVKTCFSSVVLTVSCIFGSTAPGHAINFT